MESEVKGNKLILTIDLSTAPVQSKSALAKAIEKGRKPETVPANLIYSTGGFTRVGNARVSLNVMKG